MLVWLALTLASNPAAAQATSDSNIMGGDALAVAPQVAAH